MKHISLLSVFCFFCCLFSAIALAEDQPGLEPQVFAPGVISSPDVVEMGCSLSPCGTEFYFARNIEEEGYADVILYVSKKVDGQWTKAQKVSFSGQFREFSPFVTYDNQHPLFYRMAKLDEEEDSVQRGTWIAKRTAEGWSEPRFFLDRYCVTTADFQTFYFGFMQEAAEGRNIGCVTLKEGKFSPAQLLPGKANSSVYDAHPYIFPGGNILAFDSHREGSFGRGDMYITRKQEDGTWSEGENLGEVINTGHRIMPSISPDGTTLFFSSEGDIWWVKLP